MNCLRSVTYGCIVVTHGASQRHRKSRASQSRTRFTATIRSFARCSRQDGSRPLSLPSPSLSISSASRTIETGCSGVGREDCVHRKAFRSVGRTSSLLRQRQRVIAERYCESRFRLCSPAEQEAWVNRRQVAATQFSWNIGLIVCCRQSWNRSMNSWCLTGDGRFRRHQFRRN